MSDCVAAYFPGYVKPLHLVCVSLHRAERTEVLREDLLQVNTALHKHIHMPDQAHSSAVLSNKRSFFVWYKQSFSDFH